MTKPLIVTSPLAAALAELTKNAALPASAIAREHPELIGTFCMATIKSFEYAYELGGSVDQAEAVAATIVTRNGRRRFAAPVAGACPRVERDRPKGGAARTSIAPITVSE
jgi:hypothetical protein